MSKYIIKKKYDDQYINYDDYFFQKWITTKNILLAQTFATKKEAKETIKNNWLELHLGTEFIILNK